MAIPGTPTIQVLTVANNNERSGRGRVINCGRCKVLCEVVEYR